MGRNCVDNSAKRRKSRAAAVPGAISITDCYFFNAAKTFSSFSMEVK